VERLQGPDVDPQIVVGGGILLLQAPGDGVEVGARLVGGDAGFQASKHVRAVVRLAIVHAAFAGPQAVGNPHVAGVAEVVERGRQDADHGEGAVIERDGAAQQGGVAVETPLPEREADDAHGRR
jgi:hypothetical protein